ncbi:MAG: hypothetical protein AUJ57_06510 [Zetaproteobacteria bacterium CG1_02_53_45]|nr:MAG: hypothetical protein AUJ57_06510 [Zetaproteobacteria bacterium CG1_02_53_45]
MLNVTKGVLLEYSLMLPPLVLVFEFNPEEISRTRRITINTGSTPATRGGYDFTLPTETARVAQGISVEPEQFDIKILLDATDRMDRGNKVALSFGVEPEIATLRSMVEPKAQGPLGLQSLSGLGFGGNRAFERDEHASVLLFVWGSHILPVFITTVQIDEKAHLPSLVPYRAEATLSMQVIEGNNPFYEVEMVRQVASAALNTGQTVATSLGSLF